MQWLKQIAPTLVTALGGPLAGLAVEAVGKVFGWEENATERVSELLAGTALTAEQVAKIKEVEAALIQQERELGFKFADLEVRDRESARRREVDTKDSTNRNLAYTILFSFIALVMSVLYGWAKVDSVLAGTLIGYLSAKAEQVLAYYFGTTKSSAEKTAMLAGSKRT